MTDQWNTAMKNLLGAIKRAPPSTHLILHPDNVDAAIAMGLPVELVDIYAGPEEGMCIVMPAQQSERPEGKQ